MGADPDGPSAPAPGTRHDRDGVFQERFGQGLSVEARGQMATTALGLFGGSSARMATGSPSNVIDGLLGLAMSRP